jgi:2-polyprenyl-3-methyl-5-hydroxy-6-metoxy-1,4-benzoquinol methylase
MMRRWFALLAVALGACTFQGGGFAPVPRHLLETAARPEAPFVPTPQPAVDAMMELAGVGPGDFLIDLGSGDGRIVIAAARRGAHALGVDIDPERVAQASLAARVAGVEGNVLFRREDLFDTPLDQASVVSLYLLP